MELDETTSSMPRMIHASLHKPFSPDALLGILSEVFAA
jgi:hypothetical protein